MWAGLIGAISKPAGGVAPGTVVVAFNCGGGAQTGYEDDAAYIGTGGDDFSYPAPVNTSLLTDVPPQQVLRDVRYDATSFSYVISIANGNYTVRLFFNSGNGIGRTFDIDINGVTVESDYDPFVEAGSANDTATQQEYPVTVSGGEIEIVLTKTAGENALMSAVKVLTA